MCVCVCVKLDGKMPTADTGAKKRQQPTYTEERSQAARGKPARHHGSISWRKGHLAGGTFGDSANYL